MCTSQLVARTSALLAEVAPLRQFEGRLLLRATSGLDGTGDAKEHGLLRFTKRPQQRRVLSHSLSSQGV